MKFKSSILILSILFLFISSGYAINEDYQNIELEENNLMGLIFAASGEDENINDEKSTVLMGLVFCWNNGHETINSCAEEREWSEDPRDSLNSLIQVANEDQGREFSRIDDENDNEDDYLSLSNAWVEEGDLAFDGNEELEVGFELETDSDVVNFEDSEPVEVEVQIEGYSTTVSENYNDEDGENFISINVDDIWSHSQVDEEPGDYDVQLLLNEGSEGEFSWSEDDLEAGTFTVSRCEDEEIDDTLGWDISHDTEEVSQCIREASVDRNGNIYNIKVESGEGGLEGELEFRSVFDEVVGSERMNVDIDIISDGDPGDFDDSDKLKLRHFAPEGDEGDQWEVLLEEELSAIDENPDTIEFSDSREDEIHDNNIVELTFESSEDNLNNITEVDIDLKYFIDEDQTFDIDVYEQPQDEATIEGEAKAGWGLDELRVYRDGSEPIQVGVQGMNCGDDNICEIERIDENTYDGAEYYLEGDFDLHPGHSVTLESERDEFESSPGGIQ